jgi:uncharacterized protein
MTTTITTSLDPAGALLIGKGQSLQTLDLAYANRHGLIAGATGTGKTITLQILAEGFSRQGVPVFVSDVKGDLSGVAMAGKPHPKVDERVQTIGITDYVPAENPVIFWDMFGRQGHPIRVTISEMGPVLLSRLLGLSESQEGVLMIAFAYADDEGLPLLNFDDLRSIIHYVGEERDALNAEYGLITTQSIGAIQRKLLAFEQEGGNRFFGEPALEISEFMRTDRQGRGYINILAADELMRSPTLYSTFLLWMLSELFETLPEVGDPTKPKLVFFFDEAHLLFTDAPKPLMDKIEQVCRLIRSKGVGVYFITQSPEDIPVDVLGQLSNRVQHALRAFTPKDQKAVRVAAQTFRANPDFNVEEAITQLGVGEALVSTLQQDGAPSMVDKTLIRPPASRIGAITADERAQIIASSPIGAIYDKELDRESAEEMLLKRAEAKTQAQAQKDNGINDVEDEPLDRPRSRSRDAARRQESTAMEKVIESSLKYAGQTIVRRLTSRIVRGVLGSILR